MTAAEFADPEITLDSDSDDLWQLLAVGVVVDGRYRILRSLGHGGMSTVFVAHDERLGRDVAFKVLGPELAHSRELVQRFINEALTLARLDSPHVVRVLDTGTTRELHDLALPYTVLELLHGEDMRVHGDRQARQSVAEAVGYVLEACEGLAAAHAAGVIHRDLKPENLFLSLQLDGTTVLKLLDFGIARSPVSLKVLTQSGAMIGSPRYMSPEQLTDACTADPRSDIWSLGVVLYELLVGAPPFHADTPLEVCAEILTEKPVRLERLRGAVPRSLSRIVRCCLERDPARRYSDVAELARALAPFAGEGGLEAAQRVERELSGCPSSLAVAPRPSERVDARAPTQPNRMAEPVVGHLRAARRRRSFARGLFVASVAGMSALLVQAFMPELLESPMGTLSRASEVVARVGVELATSTERALDQQR